MAIALDGERQETILPEDVVLDGGYKHAEVVEITRIV